MEVCRAFVCLKMRNIALGSLETTYSRAVYEALGLVEQVHALEVCP